MEEGDGVEGRRLSAVGNVDVGWSWVEGGSGEGELMQSGKEYRGLPDQEGEGWKMEVCRGWEGVLRVV